MDSTPDAAADADFQEQQRPEVEEGFDPERTAETAPPTGASTEADPADLQEQSEEVLEDDERD